MNPAKMLQRIQFQHPKKFCLLFINDVWSYINNLKTSKKEGGEKTENVVAFLRISTLRSWRN
jgi:hypothetical protein